jgi:hypothetical protein
MQAATSTNDRYKTLKKSIGQEIRVRNVELDELLYPFGLKTRNLEEVELLRLFDQKKQIKIDQLVNIQGNLVWESQLGVNHFQKTRQGLAMALGSKPDSEKRSYFGSSENFNSENSSETSSQCSPFRDNQHLDDERTVTTSTYQDQSDQV